MDEAKQIATRSPIPKAWNLWERPDTPPSYRMQPRDIKIIEAVFYHRFLTIDHITALLGGGQGRLPYRCRLLWQYGYLERPRALRPTTVLTQQIVYGLGKKGAQLLDELYPALDIGELDWNETPKKEKSLLYIDHQLGIARCMVTIAVAAQRRGLSFAWPGHINRRQQLISIKLKNGEAKLMPDAYFTLTAPDGRVAHHYLEFDRHHVNPQKMRERYQLYFLFWKSGQGRSFKNFRVLTVTDDPAYFNPLRKTAQPIGRNNQYAATWKALLFTHAQTFDLKHPERILDSIWYYADDDTPVSLLQGLTKTPASS